MRAPSDRPGPTVFAPASSSDILPGGSRQRGPPFRIKAHPVTQNSLQAALDQAGSPLDYLRSTKYHRRENPTLYPPLIVPQVPFEFSTWEREQRAWREGVALFDQSHHMIGIFVRGRDAHKFLTGLAANNLQNTNPNRAYQMVCCNHDGQMIGDAILFHLGENEFLLYGPFLVNWVKYQASITDLDVEVEVRHRTRVYANGHGETRWDFRYQIQGPRAEQLIEKLNGGPLGDVKFFHVTDLTIAGHPVRGLRHGMAGSPGLEIWGAWEHRDIIRETILRQGEEFGIVEVGAAAYLVTGAESGWLPAVMPAIYTGEATRGYREWLPDTELEALHALTGSHVYGRIEDYYRTPHDIGYGRLVHLEHDFIGRDALSRLDPHAALKKVTLVWDADDTAGLLREMLTPGGRNVPMLHLPAIGDKTEVRYDSITANGQMAGIGHYTAYSVNERSLLTLALVDQDIEFGNEVNLHWGEAGGGFDRYMKPATEIVPIRAIVSPAPYSKVVREEYAPGWRQKLAHV